MSPDMTEYFTAVSYTSMTGTDRSFKSHKTTILLCLCWYPQRQFHLGMRKVRVRSLNRDVRNHGHREHSCHREPEESNRTNCRMLRIPQREESKSRWRSVDVYNAFGWPLFNATTEGKGCRFNTTHCIRSDRIITCVRMYRLWWLGT